MLFSKARDVEQELLMVKAASFTNKGLAEKFIFWFLNAGWLRILDDSIAFFLEALIVLCLLEDHRLGLPHIIFVFFYFSFLRS